MRLLAAVLFACFTSIAVAGLFLPVYGVIVGDGHSCLAGPYGGWRECLRSIPISALIYGPLFAIFGTFIETPIAWALIKLRD